MGRFPMIVCDSHTSEQIDAAKASKAVNGNTNITITAPASLFPAAWRGNNRDEIAAMNRTELMVSSLGGLRAKIRSTSAVSADRRSTATRLYRTTPVANIPQEGRKSPSPHAPLDEATAVVTATKARKAIGMAPETTQPDLPIKAILSPPTACESCPIQDDPETELD